MSISQSSRRQTADSALAQRGTPTIRDPTSVQETVSLCTQYAYYADNGYEVLNNLWGKDQATSGSQCTYYEGRTGSGIKWSTDWQWQGGENNVKSYAYAGKILTKGQTIAKITSMPTQVEWTYNTTNIRANVAYDVFTAADPDHVNSSGEYELMVWYVHFAYRYLPQSEANIKEARPLWRRMAYLTIRSSRSYRHHRRIHLRSIHRL
jgi:xyloglucan-specific endo-beta-1,4-glucanase